MPFDPTDLDDPNDPLPPGACMQCGRHWADCECQPPDEDDGEL